MFFLTSDGQRPFVLQNGRRHDVMSMDLQSAQPVHTLLNLFLHSLNLQKRLNVHLMTRVLRNRSSDFFCAT